MPSATPASDRWIVLKFGGTSVSHRHRWNTIGNLAKRRADEPGVRVLVVVSALSGVTNELTAIAERYSERAQSEPEVKAWSFCAAVAFKRAMGENDEAAQFAGDPLHLGRCYVGKRGDGNHPGRVAGR